MLSVNSHLVSAILLVLIISCRSVSVTTENINRPVMVGPIQDLNKSRVHSTKPVSRVINRRYVNYLTLLFGYGYSIQDSDDLFRITDVQYYNLLKKEKCRIFVDSVDYSTYSFSILVFYRYNNLLVLNNLAEAECESL